MEVRLNNKVYIPAEEIFRMYPDVFKSGKKKARNILEFEFKRIPQEEFIFGSNVKAGWKESTQNNNRAKLLITKSYLEEYLRLFVLNQGSIPDIQRPKVIVSDIKDAPPILDLTESEKFKDHNGAILEIEVRGKRDEDECFFRVKDVAACFNDIRLKDHILEKTTGYSPQDHFLFFYRPQNLGTIGGEQKDKELFLTYLGMLRYLFVSRNPSAKVFQRWASKILFAMQMGTIEQKQSVGEQLFGVSPELVSKFFGTCCVRDIPMAYLLKLTESLESMTVPYGKQKEWLVVKVGQHGKEERKTGVVGRLQGHQQEFKEFKDTMEYMHFVFVDPMYVSDVETRIKEYFSEFKMEYGNKTEVYLVHKSKLEDVKKFFRQLSIEYSGNYADIQREHDNTKSRIHDMETENRHLKDMMDKTQIIIDHLQERVAEQALTIKAFITRLIPS